MGISLNEQNQGRIRRKLASGHYGSPDEVVATALALLDEHDNALELELAGLRAKVQQGVQETEAGQLGPASDVFDELRRRNAALNRRKR